MKKTGKISPILAIVIIAAICIAVFVAFPSSTGTGTSNGQANLQKDYSYESKLAGFTPEVLTSTVFSITGTTQEGIVKEEKFTVATLKVPEEVEETEYHVLIYGVKNDEQIGTVIKAAEEAFGASNVHLLDITEKQEILDSFFAVAAVLSPFNNPQVGIPLGIILDKDDTLLAVFDWPLTLTDKSTLLSIATLGLAYTGVYSPLPIYGFNVTPNNFTLLSDEQKVAIQNALEEIYPIKVNVK